MSLICTEHAVNCTPVISTGNFAEHNEQNQLAPLRLKGGMFQGIITYRLSNYLVSNLFGHCEILLDRLVPTASRRSETAEHFQMNLKLAQSMQQ